MNILFELSYASMLSYGVTGVKRSYRSYKPILIVSEIYRFLTSSLYEAET